MKRCCNKFVTTSGDCLYRRCQFVGIKSFADVDYVVVTLKGEVVTTLYQRNANVVKTLQSGNFIKCVAKPLQRCANIVSLILVKLPLCEQ